MITKDEFKEKYQELYVAFISKLEEITKDWESEYRFHIIGDFSMDMMIASLRTINDMDNGNAVHMGKEIIAYLEELIDSFEGKNNKNVH